MQKKVKVTYFAVGLYYVGSQHAYMDGPATTMSFNILTAEHMLALNFGY